MLNRPARTYKALSLLLLYPDQELIDSLNVLHNTMKEEGILPNKHQKNIEGFMKWMADQNLLTLQEQYVELFDRGRSLSLHLFEHVHGDSRERGQAMIDLSDMYLKHGMQIDAEELPDYLPLFLEFLSTISRKEARVLLGSPVDILEALAQRLSKRNCHYHTVIKAIVALASSRPQLAMIRRLLTKETQEPLIGEELDKQWMEEPVTFMGAQCPSDCSSSGCSDPITPRRE